MSTLVLDAGALLAVDRGDRPMLARLLAARDAGALLRAPVTVIAQVWRDGRRQANLARLLRSVDVRPVDERMAREAGVLLGRAGTSDPIDAMVVLLAGRGDRILTSDPEELRRLAEALDRAVVIVPC